MSPAERFGKVRLKRAGFVGAVALGTLLAVVALSGCGGSQAEAGESVDDAALSNEADGSNWAAYGRTFSEQHYSPLREINASNVSRLGLAWSLDLSDKNFATTAPIAVDGVMYFSPGVSEVHAVDARSGKRLWH